MTSLYTTWMLSRASQIVYCIARSPRVAAIPRVCCLPRSPYQRVLLHSRLQLGGSREPKMADSFLDDSIFEDADASDFAPATKAPKPVKRLQFFLTSLSSSSCRGQQANGPHYRKQQPRRPPLRRPPQPSPASPL